MGFEPTRNVFPSNIDVTLPIRPRQMLSNAFWIYRQKARSSTCGANLHYLLRLALWVVSPSGTAPDYIRFRLS